jgi:hypothetical protein
MWNVREKHHPLLKMNLQKDFWVLTQLFAGTSASADQPENMWIWKATGVSALDAYRAAE